MRLYLINPCNPLVSMSQRNHWRKYRVWKPLGLMVIAAMTPPPREVTIIDENLGVPDYEGMPKPDLVGNTAFTSQAPRAYRIAALFRGLNQQRRRELRAVEVPVQGLPGAILHDVDARQRVAHAKQRGLAHHAGEERGQRRPFVNGVHDRTVQLIVAERVMNRLKLAQRRMVRGQPGQLFLEIDVVAALMRVGIPRAARQNLRRGALDCRTAHEALQVEHAPPRQIGLAAFDERGNLGRVRAIDRVAV